ncbi:trypsin Inhibitor like cysteine rich domain protein [Ostertagia ostertagi]
MPNLCSSGTVCVQSSTGARCMAKDPGNNCDQKNCPSGTACEYAETECIQDKACYAEPKCKNQGPQITPLEQTGDMVVNSFVPANLAGTSPPACRSNEVLNGCGALCEGKCEDVNRGPVPCPLICLPPACACAAGFYRDANNNCVTASQCAQRECIVP